MTVYDRQSGIEALDPPPLWACALLGIVMIAAGIVALGDVAFATIISVKLIGLTAIAAGAFEIMHAFWTRGWGGFHWQMILDALYLAFGLVLLTQPAFTQVMEGTVRCKNRWLLAAVLAALLVGATWYCVSVWRAAPSMPLYGNIIMGVAAILVLVAGCGLITLIFYTHRKGYDESARSNRPPRE
jgi:uncharacterized membrane protein HdeD (DUF308 family)